MSIIKARPVDQAHDDEEPLGGLPNVLSGDDAGMIQAGDGSGLAPEAFDPPFILHVDRA